MQRLCQLNLARFRPDLQEAERSAFTAMLATVNRQAEAADGFHWRYEGPVDEEEAVRVFGEPRLWVNLSAWATVAGLRSFVQGGDHARMLAQRKRWFEPMQGPTQVLWWADHGRWPDLPAACERLQRLRAQGPSEQAFTLQQPFAAPGSSMVPPRV